MGRPDTSIRWVSGSTRSPSTAGRPSTVTLPAATSSSAPAARRHSRGGQDLGDPLGRHGSVALLGGGRLRQRRGHDAGEVRDRVAGAVEPVNEA